MEKPKIMVSVGMHPTDKRWFAVHTKYKCEKYVAENLAKKGVHCYTPILETVKIYKSKKKIVRQPLINCYVFVLIDESEYIKVLQSEYVYSFLSIGKKIISIPSEEIDTMKRVVGEMENIDVDNYNYAMGDNVEMISGNLTGIKGTVVDSEGKTKLVIQLKTIGLQLRITVNKSHLKPLRASA